MATDRAEEIRLEAVRLFSQQGYDATSMRDIAKAVGLLPGSLYAHISSKEQLLLDIIEGGIDEFLAAVAAAVGEGGSAPEKLRRAVQAHMRVIATGHERTAVVFHQWRSLSGEDRARVQGKRNGYQQQFVDILDAGILEGTFKPELDSHFAVLVILGALNWAPEWFSPAGKRTADEVAERVSALLLGGLEVEAA